MSPRKIIYRELVGDYQLTDIPLRTKGRKSSFYTEEHEICDGEVKIVRTKQSGDVWQMRIWVPSEKKYIKKSLRTKSLEEAKLRARDKFYEIQGLIRIGQKIFTITTGELVGKYLDYQQGRVIQGLIGQGTHTSITSHMRHFLSFVGVNTRLDSILGKKYKGYFLHRKKTNPEVTRATLIHERSSIGHLYKWAIGEGLITQERFPQWEELKRTAVSKRAAFTKEDYRTLYTYLNNYTKGIKDEKELYYRKLIRDFILIQSNTGLRFGECIQLRWSYVSVHRGNQKYPYSKINVPENISKVKRDRTAIGLRGDYFTRIKTYSPYKDSNDFIFADYNTGEMIKKKTCYRYWRMILKDTELDKSPNDYTYYCLRHTFATFRLQFGKVDIRTLAKVMGCSVTYVEKHYDAARVENMADYITRLSPDDKVLNEVWNT